MKPQTIIHETLDNGLTLLIEPMSHVQSAAFAILTPGGSIYEESGKCGTSAALCDLLTRGAGDLDSRQLSNALDGLGVQRHESVGWNFITLSGATLASNLPRVCELYAEILQRPRLPADQLEAVLAGVEQGLLAVEDDPQRKVLVELRKRCYDEPWGRSTDGELSDLERIHIEAIQRLYTRQVQPRGTIIGIAGAVDAGEIIDQFRRHWGEWQGAAGNEVVRTPHQPGYHHVPHDSTQTHLGLAYRSVPFGDADYYSAWAAVSILSGGSSSRLFTEVREKRGLCYSVYASHHSLLTEGRVLVYSGTNSERAQETLDVILAELERLAEGIAEDELWRCQARAKSSLIMQQESTSARAAAIARDWFHLGRTKTLAEVRQAVDDLTLEGILDFVRRHPPRGLTILSVGPQPLIVPQWFTGSEGL